MRTDDNGIVLPQEIPEGYELAYRRQSIRQTYSYDSNGVPCFLIVCKEEFKEGAAEEKSDPESHVSELVRYNISSIIVSTITATEAWENCSIYCSFVSFLSWVFYQYFKN